jgi:hypothetical protein
MCRRVSPLVVVPLLLTALAACSAADTPAERSLGAIGVLYATHTDTLSLQGSYRLWADDGWAAYADVFWAPAVEAVGGGVSVAAPPDTPMIREILRFSSADRIGVGLHYDGRWQGTVYVVKDLVAF